LHRRCYRWATATTRSGSQIDDHVRAHSVRQPALDAPPPV
jgi:hypothetical protein